MSAKDVGHGEGTVGEGERGKMVPPTQGAEEAVARSTGLPRHGQGAAVQVNQPDLWDGVAGIERQLDRAIDLAGALGNLHQQEDVGRPGVPSRVEVCPRDQEHQVRLGLVLLVKLKRVLDTHLRIAPKGANEKVGQAYDAGGVAASDGGHLDDLPGDELEAVILGEDASLDHLLELPNGEAAARQRQSHPLPPAGIVRRRALAVPAPSVLSTTPDRGDPGEGTAGDRAQATTTAPGVGLSGSVTAGPDGSVAVPGAGAGR